MLMYQPDKIAMKPVHLLMYVLTSLSYVIQRSINACRLLFKEGWENRCRSHIAQEYVAMIRGYQRS